VEFYPAAPVWRKSVRTLVRQLRGPHLSTWAWCSKRSRRAVTAAVCDRVAILHEGRVVHVGPPGERGGGDLAAAFARVAGQPAGTA